MFSGLFYVKGWGKLFFNLLPCRRCDVFLDLISVALRPNVVELAALLGTDFVPHCGVVDLHWNRFIA